MIYAGSRRWRDGVAALKNRTPEQRERERVAMENAIAAVTADGKRVGEAIAAKRAGAPCVPGRIRSRMSPPTPKAAVAVEPRGFDAVVAKPTAAPGRIRSRMSSPPPAAAVDPVVKLARGLGFRPILAGAVVDEGPEPEPLIHPW